MHITDFDYFGISCVNDDDIKSTGAELKDVNLFTIVNLQKFVDDSGVEIAMIHNGITTGKHGSPLHPKGLAIDIAVIGVEKIYPIWKSGISFFGGVGVYWNGVVYSLHLDMRPTKAYWSGKKNIGEKNWKYSGVFSDPKSIT